MQTPTMRIATTMVTSLYAECGQPFQMTVVTRPYHNFAPFVRQIGERKAQACAKAILQQLRAINLVSDRSELKSRVAGEAIYGVI